MHFATRRAFNPAALFSDSRSRKTALAAGARKIAVGAGRRAEKTAASKLPCKINGRSLLRARKWRQTSTWYCGTTGFTKRRAKIRSNPATRRWPFLARANSDWSGVRQARRAAQRGKKVSRSPRFEYTRPERALGWKLSFFTRWRANSRANGRLARNKIAREGSSGFSKLRNSGGANFMKNWDFNDKLRIWKFVEIRK